MPGCLDVLSIGRGHLSFDFDKADAAEVDRARRVIEDMLARGYAIFVETPEGLQKVKRFDPATDHYVMADVPALPEPRKKGRPKGRRIPMREAKATGVGPTAGG